ncbi:DEAD/DEAH box helicase [Methanocella sp. MCL-LM]|uniref:DEAD/DEAH box helicase n=1 Tax=Methanocella sp. MCL-LM TaxID=3412035 RepID=UPI003C76E846
MLSDRPDFGDINDIYKQLKSRRSGNIIFRLDIDEKNLYVPGISYELARAMGVRIRRDDSIDKDDLRRVIINKFRSLNTKRVEFLVENVFIGEAKHEGSGRWRLRVRPDIRDHDDVTVLNHTLVIVCVRQAKRLHVTRLSMEIMPGRPHIAEGLLAGPVTIVEGLSESYLTDEDFKWLNSLVKRKDHLEKRLSEWEEYLKVHLSIIKNKEGWLIYRNLQRISPTQASIEIFTRLFSKNANKSFFPLQDVNIIKGVPAPANGDWKPDENTDDSVNIGAFEKGCPIRAIFKDQDKKKDDWITVNIDLIDKFVWEPGRENRFRDPLDRLTKPSDGVLINSTLRDSLPLMLQQKAIDRLKETNSANCRLEDFIFGISQARLPTRDEAIDRETLVEKKLNQNQYLALQKSLNTPDIALIQGPPGTGKTTVIAELCNQVTLRKGRVLLASQSNLAVYNALSRLSNKSHIMPIRIGRSWKPEDGEDEFEEENVIRRWFGGIRSSMEEQTQKIELLKSDLKRYESSIEEVERTLHFIGGLDQRLASIDEKIADLRNRSEKYSSKIEDLNDKKADYERSIEILKKLFDPDRLSLDALEPALKEFPGFKDFLVEKVDVLSDVYDPANCNIWKRCKNDTILTTLFANIVVLRKNNAVVNDLLGKLNDLIVSAQLHSETNAEINLLKQKRAKCTEEMTQVTDANDQRIFREIVEINKRIADLEGNVKASIIHSQWKAELINLSPYLNIFSSFENMIEYHPSDGVTIDELKTSIKPDKKYRHVIRRLTLLMQSIVNRSIELDSSLRSRVQFAINDKDALLSEVIENVNGYKRELDSLTTQASVLQTEQATINANLENARGKIQSEIDIIETLRQKYLILLNRTLTPVDWTEDEDFLSQIKSEYDDIYSDQKEIIREHQHWGALRAEWVKRIKKSEENPSKEDYEDVKEKYIELANVIGATCTETGKYNFWSKHGRDFDLVIVDEVSKATLPELLMPMLLGKQIILVGDHKQLPPMFNINEREVTFDEAQDSVDAKEELAEKLNNFRKLVTSSYFEEMFTDADDGLRSRLTEQYRMHPTIMRAVNQFYPGRYTLTCGLKDPDNERSHPYIFNTKSGRKSPKNSHLMWVDSSYRVEAGRKIQNYETREDKSHHGSESRFNLFEVDVIVNLLRQIDTEYKGDANSKQDIAVISFYMGQIRKLRESISAMKNAGELKNLNIRLGSVDRFQGMERPIVIASLVSSPSPDDRRQTPTGHVKEFRRINVAFSRAQSLLVIVGSADVFENLTIRIDHEGEMIREMVYKNIINMAEDGADGCCFVGGYDLV